MPLILVTSCTPQAAHTRWRRARPACIPGSQQHELPSPLAFLCDGSFGVAPVLLLAQFPQRQGGAPKVFLETSYSVQTEGRGGGFQGGDQAEPGPPPPLWPQGGRWALSRVKSALCGHVGSERAGRAPPVGSRPGGGQPQVGCRKSPPLPVQAVLSTSPSPPSQGQTKTYQTFGLEGAVPPPPLPLLTGGRAPSSSCSHRHWRFIWEMQRGGSPQVWRLLSAPRTAVVLRSSSLLLEHPCPSPGPLAS